MHCGYAQQHTMEGAMGNITVVGRLFFASCLCVVISAELRLSPGSGVSTCSLFFCFSFVSLLKGWSIDVHQPSLVEPSFFFLTKFN